MENLRDYTPIELNRFIHDANTEHANKKTEILKILDELKNLEDRLNREVDILDNIEKRYIALLEELNSRKK